MINSINSQNIRNRTKMIDKRIADPETDEIVSVSLKKVCCSALKRWEKA